MYKLFRKLCVSLCLWKRPRKEIVVAMVTWVPTSAFFVCGNVQIFYVGLFRFVVCNKVIWRYPTTCACAAANDAHT